MTNKHELPINPHAWRRFKLAERNMLALIRRGPYTRKRFRAVRKWAQEVNRWIERLFP